METISENCVQIYSRCKVHPFWLHTYISDSEVERTIFKTVGECPTKCTNKSRKTKIQIINQFTRLQKLLQMRYLLILN